MSLNTVFSSMLETHRWPAMLMSLLAGSLMTLAYDPFGLSLLVFPLLVFLKIWQHTYQKFLPYI